MSKQHYSLEWNRDDFTLDSLTIFLDEKIQPIQISGKTISFDVDSNIGFHCIRVQLHDRKEAELLRLLVNEVDAKHMIYFSFHKINSKMICPRTTVSETENLYIPHILPVSHWVSAMYNRIPNKLPFEQLEHQYKFYYPESLEIEGPQNVKDFFLYNLDFYCYDKKENQSWEYNKNIPYLKCDFPFKRESVLADVRSLMYDDDIYEIENSSYNPSIKKTDRWSIHYLTTPETLKKDQPLSPWDSRLLFDKEKYSELYAFLNSLPVKNISLVYLGILPAGKTIHPHSDNTIDYDQDFTGLHTLYVTLNEARNNYFKLHTVGLLPTDTPVFVNIHQFVHSLVNVGNDTRYILGIRCDLSEHGLNRYIVWD